MPPAGTVGTPGPVSLPCPVLAIGGHRGILFALAPCPPRHLCSLLFLLPVGSRRKRTAIARGPLCGSLGFELCHQSQGRLRREGRNPASLCCWGRAGCGPSPPGSTPQRGTLQPRALISPVLFPSPAPARGGQEVHGTVLCSPLRRLGAGKSKRGRGPDSPPLSPTATQGVQSSLCGSAPASPPGKHRFPRLCSEMYSPLLKTWRQNQFRSAVLFFFFPPFMKLFVAVL